MVIVTKQFAISFHWLPRS